MLPQIMVKDTETEWYVCGSINLCTSINKKNYVEITKASNFF